MNVTQSFRVGDCVKVRDGVKDPDFEMDISGWQGRVSVVDEFEDETIVAIQWDSITLKNMPPSLIEQCDEEGFDWSEISLSIEDIEAGVARDDEHEVEHVIHSMTKHIEFAHLGERGERIQRVIAGIDEENYIDALTAWNNYLSEVLSFPFAAKVDEFEEEYPFPRGEVVQVMSIHSLDDAYGVAVQIEHNGDSMEFPLCDLAALDKESKNYEAIKDYRVWFANR